MEANQLTSCLAKFREMAATVQEAFGRWQTVLLALTCPKLLTCGEGSGGQETIYLKHCNHASKALRPSTWRHTKTFLFFSHMLFSFLLFSFLHWLHSSHMWLHWKTLFNQDSSHSYWLSVSKSSLNFKEYCVPVNLISFFWYYIFALPQCNVWHNLKKDRK